MLMKKILVYLLISIMLMAIVTSQNEDRLREEDYKDANKINDALKNNPSLVEYSKIDYSDQGLDYKLLDYNKIPPDKFKNLDMSRVSYQKLFSDIGRNDLSINLNSYQLKLEKSSAGERNIFFAD